MNIKNKTMVYHSAKAIIKEEHTTENMMNEINTLAGSDICFYVYRSIYCTLVLRHSDFTLISSCTKLFPNIDFKFSTYEY